MAPPQREQVPSLQSELDVGWRTPSGASSIASDWLDGDWLDGDRLDVLGLAPQPLLVKNRLAMATAVILVGPTRCTGAC